MRVIIKTREENKIKEETYYQVNSFEQEEGLICIKHRGKDNVFKIDVLDCSDIIKTEVINEEVAR